MNSRFSSSIIIYSHATILQHYFNIYVQLKSLIFILLDEKNDIEMTELTKD